VSFQLYVEGPRACFRRPEFSTDLVTYDIITPPAVRGLFEAIHWTPSISWRVLEIQVINPIRSEWLGSAPDDSGAVARGMQILRDVAYLVSARFELTDKAHPSESAGQHARMFARRARRQDFYRRPFLGLTEFPAEISLVEEPRDISPLNLSADLGWMVFDAPAPEKRRFFRAVMECGIVRIPEPTEDLPG
jgi:CRISPR-associated protein Cas5d